MKRVEFRLSMPSRGSWNGAWSGSERRFAIVRSMTDKAAAKLLDGRERNSWYHRWSDGWGASVSARIVAPGERLPKSDGFAGYDWMVANILAYGSTEKPELGEPAPTPEPAP